MYLALDPGARTGWAWFDEEGELVDFGIFQSHDELDDFLNERQPGVIIYEGYYNNPSIKQGGSKMPQSIAIGRIHAYCYRTNTRYYEQLSSVLPIALRWAGLRQYKGHVPDDKSAIAHGVFWLQRHGIRKSRLIRNDD